MACGPTFPLLVLLGVVLAGLPQAALGRNIHVADIPHLADRIQRHLLQQADDKHQQPAGVKEAPRPIVHDSSRVMRTEQVLEAVWEALGEAHQVEEAASHEPAAPNSTSAGEPTESEVAAEHGEEDGLLLLPSEGDESAAQKGATQTVPARHASNLRRMGGRAPPKEAKTAGASSLLTYLASSLGTRARLTTEPIPAANRFFCSRLSRKLNCRG